jgi:acyl-CoA synthetase (AMP-forming)/AMP-acid ligase II
MFASQFRFTTDSVVMHAGSLVFNGAFVTLMPAWYLGCKFVLQEKFDATAFLDLVEREQVTHVMMVPSQIVAVLNAPNFSGDKLKSLRMLCSVGAPWHREHKEALLPILPNSLYELYGLTEGFITVLDSANFARKIDSVGTPIPFGGMRIVSDDGRDLPPGQPGEIVGYSPLMMPGYYKRPDLTAQTIVDGWLHTGDVGMVDEDGYLHLVDRKKDMIISGGFNIYPSDLEAVLQQHPAVGEAAVVGVPSERWGETPVAFAVRKPGHTETSAEIRAWVDERVGKTQRLADFEWVDALPRSAIGKVLKRQLRDEYALRTNSTTR